MKLLILIFATAVIFLAIFGCAALIVFMFENVKHNLKESLKAEKQRDWWEAEMYD